MNEKKEIEIKYFATGNEVKKAIKIVVRNKELWTYGSFGSYLIVVDENELDHLFDTEEDAKACIEREKAEREKNSAEEMEREAKQFDEVTEYLDNFDVDEIFNSKGQIAKKYRKFVNAIKYLFEQLPSEEKNDTEEGYAELLERYITYGNIYTQGMAFRPDQIQSVCYGEDGAVRLQLTGGKTIIPKSKSVTRLIKVIFGENAGWTYNDVGFPEGDYDKTDDDED